MRVRVHATYIDGCNCKRPALNAEVSTPLEPVFHFAKAAQSVAAMLRASQFQINKRSTGRSAYAEIATPCNHRERQAIRIAWRHY